MNFKKIGVPFSEVKKKLMSDPKVEEAYKELAPTYEMIKQIINARMEQNLTQADLAKRMGTKQSNISRLESGNYNPSLNFLQKMALSLGKDLHIVLN
ncbi:MAG: helix-turn-helix transcriptional regulator [Patescibacteria group bacterium]|nr:helix-turn-helix transcriptional regulator [Patescibacteria group bacterium]